MSEDLKTFSSQRRQEEEKGKKQKKEGENKGHSEIIRIYRVKTMVLEVRT